MTYIIYSKQDKKDCQISFRNSKSIKIIHIKQKAIIQLHSSGRTKSEIIKLLKVPCCEQI